MEREHHYIVDIMSKQVHTIDLDADLSEAESLMEEQAFRHLPVIDDGKLVGMLSKTDINELHLMSEFVQGKLNPKSFFEVFSIEQLMTKEVKVIASDTSIKDVAKIFSESNYHALPVVEGGSLVGLVSVKDVLKYYAR